MKWGIEIRALVYLRRIARSLESLAKSQATLADIASSQIPVRVKPKHAILGEMTYTKVAEAEAKRQREREHEGTRTT